MSAIHPDDYSLTVERLCSDMRGELEARHWSNLRAAITYATYETAPGTIELVGGNFGNGPQLTIILASALHDHLHEIGISGPTCHLLEHLIAEAQAVLAATDHRQ